MKQNNKNIFVFDSECTTINGIAKENKIRVYYWDMVNLTDNEFYEGTTIYDLMKTLKNFKRSITIICHNLGGYDIWFWYKNLFKNYNINLKIKKTNDMTLMLKENKTLLFGVLNNKVTEYYKPVKNTKIPLKNAKTLVKKSYININLWDSLQMMPNTSIAKLGDALNYPKDEIKHYHIVPTWKTPYQMRMDKNGNLSGDSDVTGEIVYKYAIKDLNILRLSILEYFKVIPKEFIKPTLGWTVYNYWKKEFVGDFGYKILFPKFSYELWQDLSKWYRGGITSPNHDRIWKYNPKTKTNELKTFKNVKGYDINSMYPAMMRNEKMPVGQPIVGDTSDKSYDLKLYKITVTHLWVENAFQFYPKSKILVQKQYSKKIWQDFKHYPKHLYNSTIYVTNNELDLMKTYYKGFENCLIECCYSFKSSKLLFKKYIDLFMDLKIKAEQDNNEVIRMIAKLCMNALYGKFGQNPFQQSKIFIPTAELFKLGLDIKHYHVEIDDYVLVNQDYIEEIEIDDSNKYIPIAIWITAYSHVLLVIAINSNWLIVLYWDTDSLKVTSEYDVQVIEIDNYKLGAWKYENTYEEGKFRAPKQYFLKNCIDATKEKDLGKDIVILAGIAKEYKNSKNILWSNFTNQSLIVKNGNQIKVITDDGIYWFYENKELTLQYPKEMVRI